MRKSVNCSKITFSTVCALIALCTSSVCWPATYYVDATGGNDSNAGTATNSSWKTIAKVNSSKYLPGDQILFKRGEIWREQLIVPSSGSVGNPITFWAYGAGALPIISGADIISRFTDNGSNVWYATGVTTQPKITIFGSSTLGTNVASIAAVNGASKWYWQSNTLYVYTTSDPSGTIQAGARAQAILVGKDYITVKDIEVQGSNEVNYGGNIFVFGSGYPSHFTADNVTSQYSTTHGIAINTEPYYTGGSHLIKNSTLKNNRLDGFAVVADTQSDPGKQSTIQNCLVYGNRQEGITIAGNNWIVEHNTVRDNGLVTDFGTGIHIFGGYTDTGVGDNVIIRYNIIYNQVGHGEDGAGIGIDQWCDYNEAYYNVIYNTTGPGIYLFDASHARVYNNTIWHTSTSAGANVGQGGIRATATSTSYALDAIIKNNNVFSDVTGDYAIFVDGEYIANNIVITNNNFYRATGSWYFWNTNTGSNLATFNALTGIRANISSDPLFVSPSTGDFHLKLGSLAIDGGTDVGLTQDYDGNHVPMGGAQDIGAYENRNAIPPSTPQNLRLSFIRY